MYLFSKNSKHNLKNNNFSFLFNLQWLGQQMVDLSAEEKLQGIIQNHKRENLNKDRAQM